MDQSDLFEYLNDNLDEQERKAIERWLTEDRQNQIYFEQIKHIWENSDFETTDKIPNVDLSWKQVKSRIGRKKIRKLPVWYRAAAAIFILGLATYFIYPLINEPSKHMVTVEKTSIQNPILLEDGTKVWLNENSQLIYPEQFDPKERIVELSGEGYFEVAEMPSRPFTVKTDVTAVKVLGTSFNVKAYPDSSKQNVLVNTGKVAFYSIVNDQEQLILERGEGGSFDIENNELSLLSNFDQNELSWKTKVLVFKDNPLQEAIEALEKVFKIEIELSDEKINNCALRARLPIEERENSLEVIASLFDLTIEKLAVNRYLLKGEGCE